jgi:hypothetical protein
MMIALHFLNSSVLVRSKPDSKSLLLICFLLQAEAVSADYTVIFWSIQLPALLHPYQKQAVDAARVREMRSYLPGNTWQGDGEKQLRKLEMNGIYLPSKRKIRAFPLPPCLLWMPGISMKTDSAAAVYRCRLQTAE